LKAIVPAAGLDLRSKVDIQSIRQRPWRGLGGRDPPCGEARQKRDVHRHARRYDPRRDGARTSIHRRERDRDREGAPREDFLVWDRGGVLNIRGGAGNPTSLLDLVSLMKCLSYRQASLAFADWRPGNRKSISPIFNKQGDVRLGAEISQEEGVE